METIDDGEPNPDDPNPDDPNPDDPNPVHTANDAGAGTAGTTDAPSGGFVLDDVSLRVLGSLIEKSTTTPDNYPLTLNSLRLACNQSTSRDPVVDYGEVEISSALTRLRELGFTRTVHSTSNRGAKYRHVAADALGRPPDDADGELAVLAVLMLRGPQTPGQLKTRTERQHGFDDLDDVQTTLTRLAADGLVMELERQPGQKDARWGHLLGDSPPVAPGAPHARTSAAAPTPSDDPSAHDPYAHVADLMQIVPWELDWEDFVVAALEELVDLPQSGSIVVLGTTAAEGLAVVSDALIAGSADRRLIVIEPSPSLRAGLAAATMADDRVEAWCVPDWETALVAGPVIAVVFGWLARVPPAQRADVWRALPTVPVLIAAAGTGPVARTGGQRTVAGITYSVSYDGGDPTTLAIAGEVSTGADTAARSVVATVGYAPVRPASLEVELAPFGLVASWHLARTNGADGNDDRFVGGATLVRRE